MGLIRLRPGEWLALAGGVALAVSLFLPWYGARAREATVTGLEAFSATDVLLALVAAAAVALAAAQATHDSPAIPVGAGVVAVVLGFLGTLLVLVRIVNQPGPNEFIEVKGGAWLGLAAAVAITAGAWLAIATERVRGLPPGPEPELRATPGA